jgi:polyisoprenoid-binding protein YceI
MLLQLLTPLVLLTATDLPAALPDTGTLRFVVAAQGNEARYRVREQLAGVNLPNDAVGVTPGVAGVIVLTADGGIDREASRITVDLTLLRSDRDRRDNFLQRRTLETEQHPHAVLVPTAMRGLPWPLPTSGTHELELVGDLTIKDVTRPVTWQVALTSMAPVFTGTATTTFRFEEFGLTRPRVASVLSVADDITLELDFRFVRDGGV